MNWDDAKILLAVAANGSFAAAARELGVTHPTVGRRMSQLEIALGLRLVERHAEGTQLTPAGEKLLEHAEAMARAAGRFELSATERTKGPEGTVRLSCGSPMLGFITVHLDELFNRCPAVRLELDDSTRYVNLSRSESDIAIRARLPEQGALKTRKIVEADMAIYAARRYLDDRPFDTSQPLSDHDWITHDERMSHYPYMHWLMPRLEGIPPRLRVTRRYAMIDAAVAGLGLALLPIAEGNRVEGLECLTPPILELRFPLYLIAHEEVLAASRVRAVWKWLEEVVRRRRGEFTCSGTIST